jgi:hypothetical protein
VVQEKTEIQIELLFQFAFFVAIIKIGDLHKGESLRSVVGTRSPKHLMSEVVQSDELWQ